MSHAQPSLPRPASPGHLRAILQGLLIPAIPLVLVGGYLLLFPTPLDGEDADSAATSSAAGGGADGAAPAPGTTATSPKRERGTSSEARRPGGAATGEQATKAPAAGGPRSGAESAAALGALADLSRGGVHEDEGSDEAPGRPPTPPVAIPPASVARDVPPAEAPYFLELESPTNVAAPWPEAAHFGTVRGTRVNLRVGPRTDNRPVTQLSTGDAVVVVGRAGEWLAVCVPEGFRAAISSRYVEKTAPGRVTVTGSQVNLRVEPPEDGRPMPGAFRGGVVAGQELEVLGEVGEWTWVFAPLQTPAWIHEDYVVKRGPIGAHMEALLAGLDKRVARIRMAHEERRRHTALAQDARLRDVLAGVQKTLARIRAEGGIDRTPVVAIADTLDRAVEANPLASERVVYLCTALRGDLESEIAIRLARADAETARHRGLQPAPERPLAPRHDAVTAVGIIRHVEVERWRREGLWVLWEGDKPVWILRLAPGLPDPWPDFAANADGAPRQLSGSAPGEVEMGIPVLEVKRIEALRPPPVVRRSSSARTVRRR